MIYFIIGYILYLVVFAIFSFVAFYHLRRYGYKEGASSTMMVVYSIISVSFVVVTFMLLILSGFSFPDNARLFY